MTTKCDVPQFWLENKEVVYAYIKKRVGDEATTQDLCQEVLLKVYKYCALKTGVKNIRSWLFEIAGNTIIDYYRKEKKVKSLTRCYSDSPTNNESDIYQSLSIYIRPLLVCLPDIYAHPLKLDLDGIDQKDISKYLGLELSATKSRIQRSKLKMKELFFECFYLDLDSSGRINAFEPKPDCQAIKKFTGNRRNNFFDFSASF
jgi:RNA polymerase sigma-70 factor (ECF subfamily)